MPTIDLGNAELVGIIIETLLYGVFFVLFPLAINALLVRRKLERKVHSDSEFASLSFGSLPAFNKVVLVVSGSLFLSITGHWIINLLRLWDAFVKFRDAPGGPAASYGDLASSKNVAKTVLLVHQFLAGDSIIAYRLFIVWSRNKLVMVFPVFSILGVLVTGIGVIYEFTRVGDGSIFAVETKRWITCVFSFTLATNIYSTSMITYRIWRTDSLAHKKRIGGSSLRPVIRIIVESAALYTVCSGFAFITFLSSSNIQFPAIDLTTPVIGIALCLLVVRARFSLRGGHGGGMARGKLWVEGSGSGGGGGDREHGLGAMEQDSELQSPGLFGRSQRRSDGRGYSIKPIAVSVTKHVDHDVEDAFGGTMSMSTSKRALNLHEHDGRDEGDDTGRCSDASRSRDDLERRMELQLTV